MEKPVPEGVSSRLGAWNPRAVGVMEIPLDDEVDAEGCMGVDAIPAAEGGKTPSACAGELGEQA